MSKIKQLLINVGATICLGAMVSLCVAMIAIVLCGFYVGALSAFPASSAAPTPQVPLKVNVNASIPQTHLVTTASAQASDTPFQFFKDNIDKYMRATVMISGTQSDSECSNENPSQQCHGSGVVIAADRAVHKSLILTNKHVIAGDALLNCDVWVYAYNEVKPMVGKVIAVGTKTGADLALIEVEGDLDPMKFAAAAPEMFDDVFNVNIARCVRNLIAYGKVLQPSEEVFGGIATALSLPSDGGSSGSPVYNMSGDIVGLIFAGARVSVPTSYMVPLSTIKTFLADFGVSYE